MTDGANMYITNSAAGNLYIGNGTTTYVNGNLSGMAQVYLNNHGGYQMFANTSAGYKVWFATGGTNTYFYNTNTGSIIWRNAADSATILSLDNSGNMSVTGALSASNLSGTNTGDQTNISGNAATATSSYWANLISTSVSGWMVSNAGNGSGAHFYLAHSAGYGMHVTSNGITSSGIYIAQFYNGSSEIFGVYADGTVKANGNIVITSGNYNSYAPTLTGGGASGTWGINITGGAGSAGTVTHNSGRTDSTYYNVGWFAGSPSPAYSCNAVQIQSSTGTLTATNLVAYGGGTSWGDVYIGSNSGWGSGNYPTIGSNGGGNNSSSLIMLQHPHVPFLTGNGAGSDSGRASIRMAVDTSASNWWDMGLYGDAFHLYRNAGGGRIMTVDSSGNAVHSGAVTAGEVYSNGWLRTTGGGGVYFGAYGRGVRDSQAEGSSFGNLCTYGTGYNSWTGYSIHDPSGYFYSLMSNGNSPGFYSESQGYWVWYYGAGNYCLGIGSSSTTSGYALQVNGSAYITANMQIGQGVGNYSLTFYSSNYGAGYAGQIIGLNSDGNTHFYARNGSSSFTDIGYWSQNGFYITAYNSYSDIRLKNVIETNPTINVDGIDIIKYTLKTDSDTIRYGYSAQQVQEILPDIVKQDYNIDGTPGMLTLNYNDLHTLKIASLEKKVKELQTQINQLLNK
jgi:Chaperone of endosialidase